MALDGFRKGNVAMEKYFSNQHLQWVKSGEYIQRTIDSIDYIYYLSKGLAIVSRINRNGEETVIRYAQAPTFLGVPMIISAHKLFYEVDTEISACSDCKIYKIPYHRFLKIAKDHVEIYEQMIVEQAQETRFFRNLMKYSANGKKANAVALFLENSLIEENGELILPSKISFTAMANFLHIHPVTVSKIIKKFMADEILVRKENRIYVLHLDRLREYADGKECIYWNK